jgi:hypothetical protein
MLNKKSKRKILNFCKNKKKTNAKNSLNQLKTDTLILKVIYAQNMNMLSHSDLKYSFLKLEKDHKTKKKTNLLAFQELKAFKKL